MTSDNRPDKQYRERQRSLTDHDIEDILLAFERRPGLHDCRFKGVSEEDFYESVRFFRTLNENLNNGKNVIMKTVLVLIVTFLFGVLGAGILGKIKGP